MLSIKTFVHFEYNFEINLGFYVRMLGVKTFNWKTALLNPNTDKTSRFFINSRLEKEKNLFELCSPSPENCNRR